jgi:hypothetical protein
MHVITEIDATPHQIQGSKSGKGKKRGAKAAGGKASRLASGSEDLTTRLPRLVPNSEGATLGYTLQYYCLLYILTAIAPIQSTGPIIYSGGTT